MWLSALNFHKSKQNSPHHIQQIENDLYFSLFLNSKQSYEKQGN